MKLFADLFEAGFDDEAEITQAVIVIHNEDVVLVILRGLDGLAEGRDLAHGDFKRVVACATVSIHDEWFNCFDALIYFDDVAAKGDLVWDREFIGLGLRFSGYAREDGKADHTSRLPSALKRTIWRMIFFYKV